MPETIDYRLPVTIVRIQGTRTTTTSSLDTGDKPKKVERQATTALDVVADPRLRFKLCSPVDSGWKDRQLSLALMTDGRLATASAEVTDRSGERIKAVATIGAAVAGGLVAVGATPLVAGLGLAAAAGAAYTAMGIEELDLEGALLEEEETKAPPGKPKLPSAADLGIRPAFKAAHRADFELLYAYRLALLQLAGEHAVLVRSAASPATKAEDLKAYNVVLASTRAEAQRVEARYEAWLQSKQEVDVDTVDLQLYATEVPTEKRLKEELREREATHTETWWRAVSALRTMVTIDYLDGEPAPGAEPAVTPAAVAAGSAVYRPPRPAMLKTWTILEPEGNSSSFRAELVRQDRILITVPGSERTVAVVADKNAGKVEVGFDPSGAITSLAVTTPGAKADRAVSLAALPAAVQGAVTAGGAAGEVFNPRALEAKRLKRELEIAEANAKLKGPADPDPKLKELREKLAVVELEARLATAEMLSANPSAATIMVQTFE